MDALETTAEGTTPAPDANAAPVPAAAVPAVTTPPPAAKPASLEDMSMEELDAALAATPEARAKLLGTPEATPATPPPPAPDATVTPPAPETPTAEETAPGRFRLKASNFKEAEVFRLIKQSEDANRKDATKPVLTLSDAYTQVYGAPSAAAPKTEATPPVETPAPTNEYDAKISAAQAEIAALEKDIATASDEADVSKALAANRKLVAKEREVERLTEQKATAAREATAQQQTAEQQAFEAKKNTASHEAITAFPKLGDKASPERIEFDDWLATQFENPDYAGILPSGANVGNPRWPVILARDFAATKGWSTATAPAATPPARPSTPAAPAAPRVTAASVIQPGGDTSSATFKPSAQQLNEDLSKMSVDQLDGLLARAKR